jgi:hypothetical protein
MGRPIILGWSDVGGHSPTVSRRREQKGAAAEGCGIPPIRDETADGWGTLSVLVWISFQEPEG